MMQCYLIHVAKAMERKDADRVITSQFFPSLAYPRPPAMLFGSVRLPPTALLWPVGITRTSLNVSKGNMRD
jgi:hypothetical protein